MFSFDGSDNKGDKSSGRSVFPFSFFALFFLLNLNQVVEALVLVMEEEAMTNLVSVEVCHVWLCYSGVEF